MVIYLDSMLVSMWVSLKVVKKVNMWADQKVQKKVTKRVDWMDRMMVVLKVE